MRRQDAIAPSSPADVSATVLAEFAAAEILTAADVNIATVLGDLGGDRRPEVMLALALAARAPRVGDVAVDLRTIRSSVMAELEESTQELRMQLDDRFWPDPDRWADLISDSPLITTVEGAEVLDPRAPVVHDGGQHSLQRYWAYEQVVAAQLRNRAMTLLPTTAVDPNDTEVLRTLLHGAGADHQQLAVRAAVQRGLTVLIGGPGTGKTTTVAALLAVLMDRARRDGSASELRIALCAPTGKAAARLTESFRDAAQRLPEELAARLSAAEATTIHRLLSVRGGLRHRFAHGRHRPLRHDVVIVDEVSMVSLPLMARLLDALRPEARLVLVGDADQLTSVDAGAVLADIVAAGSVSGSALGSAIVELEYSRRFPSGSPLDEFARAIRAGDASGACSKVRVLRAAEVPDIADDEVNIAGSLQLVEVEPGSSGPPESLIEVILPTALDVVRAAKDGDSAEALRLRAAVQVLCAHRAGPSGVETWNRVIERWLSQHGVAVRGWYPGRPVMVTVNDHGLGLYNGDVGVVVETEGRRMVAFPIVGGTRLIAPARLDAIETVHAMTIHKSQGSEFDHVVVALPPPTSRLATRELLYTAVTRARRRVTLVGDPASLPAAIHRRHRRVTGLAEALRSGGDPANPAR